MAGQGKNLDEVSGSRRFGALTTEDLNALQKVRGDFWYNVSTQKLEYFDGTSTITLSESGASLSTSIIEVIEGVTNIPGQIYNNLPDAVSYCETNASSDDPLIILIEDNITLEQIIELTNPFYSIRTLGFFDFTIQVSDSLVGQDIITINYPTVQTNSPLGNLNIVGSTTLEYLSNTTAINIKGNGVMYLNDIRIQQFDTGFLVDNLLGGTQLVFMEGLLSIRDCGSFGVDLGNANVTLRQIALAESPVNLRIRDNSEARVESGSISGFLELVGTGILIENTPEIYIGPVEILRLGVGISVDGAALIRLDNTYIDRATVQQHFIYNAVATIEANNITVDLSKAIINSAVIITGTVRDSRESEPALNAFEELHVGAPATPREFVSGAGDSFTAGMLVFTETSGGTFTNVTTNVLEPSDGLTTTFPALTVDNAIYFGNIQVLKFNGIKVDYATAAVLGSGDIVLEYWDGSSWTEFNHMLTLSGAPYTSFANSKFEAAAGSYQVRFDDRIEDDWATNDPVSLGLASYWVRIRINTASITTAPVFNQIKIGTNRLEINSDGFKESYGRGRPLKKLPFAWNSLVSAGSSPTNQALYVSDNLFAGRIENEFGATGTDVVGLAVSLPFDFDSSCPIRLRFWYFGDDAAAGDVDFTVRWGFVSTGDAIYDGTASAPTTGPNERSLNGVVSFAINEDEIVKTVVFDLQIPEIISQNITGSTPIGSDIVFITIARNGSAGTDTYAGNAIVIDAAGYYCAWRSGGHLEIGS